MTDLYATLGIPRDADDTMIRRAYRQASKAAHPDGGGSKEAFEEVKLARDCLLDPDRRSHYDQTGDPGRSQADEGRAAVLQLLAKALDAATNAMVQRNIEPHHVDLVEQMTFWFEAQSIAIDKQRAALVTARARDQHLLGRFKVKDGEVNVLEQMVRARLDTYELNERMLDLQAKVFAEGRKLLDGFTFQPWAAYNVGTLAGGLFRGAMYPGVVG